MKHESVWPPKYIVLIALSSISKVFFSLRKNLSLYPFCMMVFIITSVSFLFLYNSLLVICAVILFKSVDKAGKWKKRLENHYTKCLTVKERKSVTRTSSNYKKNYCVVEDITIVYFSFRLCHETYHKTYLDWHAVEHGGGFIYWYTLLKKKLLYNLFIIICLGVHVLFWSTFYDKAEMELNRYWKVNEYYWCLSNLLFYYSTIDSVSFVISNKYSYIIWFYFTF